MFFRGGDARSSSRNERFSRASGAAFNLGDFASPIRAIVTRIKELSRDTEGRGGLNSYNHNTTVMHNDGSLYSTGVRNEVLVFNVNPNSNDDYGGSSSGSGSGTGSNGKRKSASKSVTVRRVYLVGAAAYKVAWVADCDISFCMNCGGNFGWTRFRHHCRACGAIVCNACSPYRTAIPALNEEGGSRVCTSCFGLRPSALITQVAGAPSTPTSAAVRSTPRPSPGVDGMSPAFISPKPSPASMTTPNTKKGNSFNEQTSPSTSIPANTNAKSPQNLRQTFSAERSGSSSQRTHDPAQQPHPQAAPMSYEACYRRMRQLIPIDVQSRGNKKIMVEQGVPPEIAARIASTKALWLICMHPDDVAMVSFCV
jgi:hypothetical protein